MVKILVARKLTGLFPVDETGEVVIRKFTPGEVVSIDVKRPRNVAFHQKFRDYALQAPSDGTIGICEKPLPLSWQSSSLVSVWKSSSWFWASGLKT